MSYFILPTIKFDIKPKNINIKFDKINNIEEFISRSLSKYLKNMKMQISQYNHHWDNFKKFSNPFEYIHTHVSGFNSGISKIKPLSRSFFKMIEIFNAHYLHKNFKKNHIDTFHLAEGPGGFIEALCYLRKNPLDKYYGMTLLNDNDNNVPGWKKSDIFLDSL